jgi:hypothetical protein
MELPQEWNSLASPLELLREPDMGGCSRTKQVMGANHYTPMPPTQQMMMPPKIPQYTPRKEEWYGRHGSEPNDVVAPFDNQRAQKYSSFPDLSIGKKHPAQAPLRNQQAGYSLHGSYRPVQNAYEHHDPQQHGFGLSQNSQPSYRDVYPHVAPHTYGMHQPTQPTQPTRVYPHKEQLARPQAHLLPRDGQVGANIHHSTIASASSQPLQPHIVAPRQPMPPPRVLKNPRSFRKQVHEYAAVDRPPPTVAPVKQGLLSPRPPTSISGRSQITGTHPLTYQYVASRNGTAAALENVGPALIQHSDVSSTPLPAASDSVFSNRQQYHSPASEFSNSLCPPNTGASKKTTTHPKIAVPEPKLTHLTTTESNVGKRERLDGSPASTTALRTSTKRRNPEDISERPQKSVRLDSSIVSSYNSQLPQPQQVNEIIDLSQDDDPVAPPPRAQKKPVQRVKFSEEDLEAERAFTNPESREERKKRDDLVRSQQTAERLSYGKRDPPWWQVHGRIKLEAETRRKGLERIVDKKAEEERKKLEKRETRKAEEKARRDAKEAEKNRKKETKDAKKARDKAEKDAQKVRERAQREEKKATRKASTRKPRAKTGKKADTPKPVLEQEGVLEADDDQTTSASAPAFESVDEAELAAQLIAGFEDDDEE